MCSKKRARVWKQHGTVHHHHHHHHHRHHHHHHFSPPFLSSPLDFNREENTSWHVYHVVFTAKIRKLCWGDIVHGLSHKRSDMEDSKFNIWWSHQLQYTLNILHGTTWTLYMMLWKKTDFSFNYKHFFAENTMSLPMWVFWKYKRINHNHNHNQWYHLVLTTVYADGVYFSMNREQLFECTISFTTFRQFHPNEKKACKNPNNNHFSTGGSDISEEKNMCKKTWRYFLKYNSKFDVVNNHGACDCKHDGQLQRMKHLGREIFPY